MTTTRQWRVLPASEQQHRLAAYRAARVTLAECPDTQETDRFLDLNANVIITGSRLPWWRK